MAARAEAPILRTGRLAEIVSRANPKWERDKHPATRSFQAIRIFVNRELDELRQALERLLPVLAPGGRLAVIVIGSDQGMCGPFNRRVATHAAHHLDEVGADVAVLRGDAEVSSPRRDAVNRSAADAAAPLPLALDGDATLAARALEEFRGVGRRFELVGQVGYVIQAGRTQQFLVKEGVAMIHADKAVGLILNRTQSLLGHSYHSGYYGRYGDYGAQEG